MTENSHGRLDILSGLGLGFGFLIIAVFTSLALIYTGKAAIEPISTASVILLIFLVPVSYVLKRYSEKSWFNGEMHISDAVNVFAVISSAALQIWTILRVAGGA